MIKKYKARTGSFLTDAKANKYGKEIEKIMKNKGGEVKPIDIVEHGKNKSSVFHNYFDWNNNSAAHKYRIQQAKNMIASIVEVVVIDRKKCEHRSFFNVKNKSKEKVYVTVETAMSNDEMRNELLTKIINHLENTQILMKMFKKGVY